MSPSHTVGLEPTLEGKPVLLDHKVSIPHSGLRTVINFEKLKTEDLESPSHTVGLELQFPMLFGVEYRKSPSHTVGLELRFLKALISSSNRLCLHPTQWA